MKPRDRRAWIATAITEQGQVSVEALSAELSVSPETIRRDLARLDADGVIRKVHGGATRSRLLVEGRFQDRLGDNVAGKRQIAEKLARLIEPGATVFIDTGSTMLLAAESLATRGPFMVITNSIRIAALMAQGDRGHQVILIGGVFGADNSETLGPLAIEQIGTLNADIALLSPAALDVQGGATDADPGEAAVARAMIARSSRLYLAADCSKFDRRAPYTIAPLDGIDTLISDQGPDGALLAAMKRQGIRIV